MTILRTTILVATLACQSAVVSTASAASAIASPMQCFSDVSAVDWRPDEQGTRRQMMLFCAQTGASVLAALNAVDAGVVPETEAGQTARQLAFNVVSGALREIEGGYQAAGQRPPTPDQFATYIPDSIKVLRANRAQLGRLVDAVWQEPRIARTNYPKVSQRIVDAWLATTIPQRPDYQR